MKLDLRLTKDFKYLILIFVLGLICVRIFNVFVYPSYEILSAVLILGVCVVGLALIWIDEVMGREAVERLNLELKAKEAEIIQSEKLAAVGRLAGGVAHELNNPLTGIVGSAELLLRRVEKENRDKDCSACFKFMEVVEKEGRRCQDLARNLLQFSRKKKGKMKPVRINEVLENTFKILAYNLNLPGAPIKLVKNFAAKDSPEENFPLVLADPDQLEQVIMNLVLNARDAMPQGGTLTITTRALEKKVYIDITDTGTGIPEEIKAKIFEPLFTTKGEGKGTGLGLSVSRDIISHHGGEIYFKTRPGEGTTFTVVLPAYEQQ